MKKFVTMLNFKPQPPEMGGDERFTESAGYIPVHVRIEQMISAGERLQAMRAEMYDVPEDMSEEQVDSLLPDPTRRPDFDLADYSRLQRDLRTKAKIARQAAQDAYDKAHTDLGTVSSAPSTEPSQTPSVE